MTPGVPALSDEASAILSQRQAAGPPALHAQLAHLFCTASDDEPPRRARERPAGPPLEVCLGVRYTPPTKALETKTVTLILLKPPPPARDPAHRPLLPWCRRPGERQAQ